jgi:hypothetical protein
MLWKRMASNKIWYRMILGKSEKVHVYIEWKGTKCQEMGHFWMNKM